MPLNEPDINPNRQKSFYAGKIVLVTGGTGFVGDHIVQALLKQGAKVRITTHRRPLVRKDESIEAVPADLTKSEDCLSATKGVDYVFHAAGAVSAAGVTVGKANAMAAISENLILTARVLEAAWTNDVKRALIFSSSTGYPVTDYPVKEEEMWSGPTHPSYFGYGWMRRYLEKMGEFVASRAETKISIVRPTAVYGSGDDFEPATSHVIPALIRKAVERLAPFEVWGTGEEIRDFLHISDLARGCLLMLENNATCDPVNIGYGGTVKIKDVVRIVLKAASYDDAEVIFNSSKPVTIPVRMVDTSKAKKLLGFEPAISLEEGLKDTVDWFVRNRVKTVS